jgi:hypothetical protein
MSHYNRAGQVTFTKYLPLIWSVEWVDISAESKTPSRGVINAESCLLAMKVTSEVIFEFLAKNWR